MIWRSMKNRHQANQKPVVIFKFGNADINSMSNMVDKSGVTLSVREREVTEILRTGGALGIKDIASNLPEYSEKMIQRELSVLVIGGRIKKTGLKRWSKYTYI